MPAIPLLHSHQLPSLDVAGLQALGNQIPNGWEPAADAYVPAAFPTPFGRAVATALVQASGQPGVPLFEQFKWLLLGVVTGTLTVLPGDLGRLDNLGRALELVDPEARYFARLVWRDGEGAVCYGASYRTCLFWGHARRTAEDWTKLSQAVQPRLEVGFSLLAQWREGLIAAEKWSPTAIGWQRAVDKIVEQSGGIANNVASLREDSAQAGPILVALPSGHSVTPVKPDWLYLPMYDKGRLKRFRALLQGAPHSATNAVTLVDTAGRVRASVAVPAVAAGASKIAAGIGAVSFFEGTAAAGTGKPQTAEFERLLEPVRRALQEAGRATDEHAVRKAPWQFPDGIRLLELIRGAVSDGLILSSAVHVECINGADLPPETSADIAFLVVGDKKLVLVDKIAGKELHELRAFGLILFQLFIGEFTLRNGVIGQGPKASIFGTSATPFAPGSDNPLEPAASSMQAVLGEPPLAVVKRLATLQRFVATYGGAEPLLAKASRSFADWAASIDQSIAPLGKPGLRNLPLAVGTVRFLDVAVDALPPSLT